MKEISYNCDFVLHVTEKILRVQIVEVTICFCYYYSLRAYFKHFMEAAMLSLVTRPVALLNASEI